MLARSLLLCGLFMASSSAVAATIYKSTDANGVVSYSDKPTPGAWVFVFRDQMVEHLETQVRLDIQKRSGITAFVVRNELFAPVEVELKLDGVSNVRTSPPRLVRQVVPARSSVTLASLAARTVGQPPRYTHAFRYALGDPSARPRAYRYPLPWTGGPFQLTQGANGRYSHFGPKGRYAQDIAMPEGTPIIAARSGMVIKVENNQSGRGTDPSGNFVRVLHDDGSMGVYLHLMQGSVVVREGQRVGLGAALARSGNTGNSTGPHLHFVIQRNVGLALESIPYQFNQPVGSLPNFAVGGQ
ncbi:peptidoglycan DD-metalloendopeptidase family protein [Pseudomonas sp. R5(2019)]|uniref:peptidoglycan DD-metalloendopeptidase family protein n=1 Tax=Pseudomonas sp. R5(2019) TaxID=2697566 RepID=UPI0014134514|nr:peptidoglycan DD-metalloendopeptidase family protein [Pseudomonas sp. R5(2019)]NBA94444.1 peptidoglycan DD-metalloendopeptidase family protein [Pseudomonas sp. R5(2019)]